MWCRLPSSGTSWIMLNDICALARSLLNLHLGLVSMKTVWLLMEPIFRGTDKALSGDPTNISKQNKNSNRKDVYRSWRESEYRSELISRSGPFPVSSGILRARNLHPLRVTKVRLLRKTLRGTESRGETTPSYEGESVTLVWVSKGKHRNTMTRKLKSDRRLVTKIVGL